MLFKVPKKVLYFSPFFWQKSFWGINIRFQKKILNKVVNHCFGRNYFNVVFSLLS